MTLTDSRPRAQLDSPLDNDSSVGTQLAYLVAQLLEQHPDVDLPTIRLDVVDGTDGWPQCTVTGLVGTITGECLSCHTTAGHPHTDYCELHRSTCPAINCPTCEPR